MRANQWNEENLGLRTNLVGNRQPAPEPPRVATPPRSESPATPSPVRPTQDGVKQIEQNYIRPVVNVVGKEARNINDNYVRPVVDTVKNTWDRLFGGR